MKNTGKTELYRNDAGDFCFDLQGLTHRVISHNDRAGLILASSTWKIVDVAVDASTVYANEFYSSVAGAACITKGLKQGGNEFNRKLTDSDNFITARRLWWQSDINENCHCGLWVLWEKDYNEHFSDMADVPMSVSDLVSELDRLAGLMQPERNKERLYIADGLYSDDGVDFPCRVCGFQVEQE